MLNHLNDFLLSRSVYRFLIAANIGWCLYGMRYAFATSTEAWWTICLGILGLFIMNNVMICIYLLAALALVNILRFFAWGVRRVFA